MGVFGPTLSDLLGNYNNPLVDSPESMQAPSIDQKSIVAADLSDTVDLTTHCRGFILRTASTLHYLNASDVEVTFVFPAGEYAIAVKRIYSTGTTLADNDMLILI